jgi:uncharacterized protein (DUF3084 family)
MFSIPTLRPWRFSRSTLANRENHNISLSKDSEDEHRRFQTEVRKLEQREKQLLKDIEQAEEDERQIQALNAEKHELDILMEDLQSQELELNETSAQVQYLESCGYRGIRSWWIPG